MTLVRSSAHGIPANTLRTLVSMLMAQAPICARPLSIWLAEEFGISVGDSGERVGGAGIVPKKFGRVWRGRGCHLST
jgi:hypothetical protein